MKVLKNITAIAMLLDIICSICYFCLLLFETNDVGFEWAWILNATLILTLLLLKKKTGRIVYYLLFWIYILIYVIAMMPIFLGGNSNNDFNENVVIVLASGFNESGELSENAILRLDASLAYKNNNVLFIVSGGQEMNGLTEADLMKKYLVDNGIAEERIIEENNSVDTYQSILNCTKYIRENDEVVIVSSSFHIFRCKLIVKNFGIKNCRFLGTDSKNSLKIYYYTREIAAIIREMCKNNILDGIIDAS